MKGRGLKGLFSGQEESLSRGFFPMSHWGKRLKLAKKESEGLRERLISPHCPFVVARSHVQCHC